ncbi:hypothetical protein [Limnoglobus roseus]|nr:hypothetical protein [Limnoglobus roseus]
MRRLFRSLLAVLAFAAVCGCTTRTDKDKNKDYDRPRASGLN